MHPLTLRPLRGPATGPTLLPLTLGERAGPILVGRSKAADWSIPDPERTVSRRHAMFTRRGDDWCIHDLQSRHGTALNGRRLGEGEQLPVQAGDLLQLGQWTFRALGARGPYVSPTSAAHVTTRADDWDANQTIANAVERTATGLGQRGLDAVLQAAEALNAAASDEAVAGAILDAVRSGIGSARALVVRAVAEGEFETLAGSIPAEGDGPRLCRSLLDGAAAERSVVELRGSRTGELQDASHSIAELGIRTAICAPLLIGGAAEAYLYLDSREGEESLPGDATAFCHALARVAGLTLERLRAADLQARHARLAEDMVAARDAQQFLLPAPAGCLGAVQYAYESRAGRIVGGDLFDAMAVTGGRAAVFLGDVSGKGVGAGVLMAAAQSQLRSHLRSGADLAEAVTELNRDLFARTASGTFVTLVAAIIDPVAERLEVVDAGHGYGVLVPPDGTAGFIRGHVEGFPLGLVPDAAYETLEFPFPPSARLVMFSDGVVEQPNPAGVPFGDDAALSLLSGVLDPGTAAASLLEAVRRHAACELADDFTVAVAWRDA